MSLRHAISSCAMIMASSFVSSWTIVTMLSTECRGCAAVGFPAVEAVCRWASRLVTCGSMSHTKFVCRSASNPTLALHTCWQFLSLVLYYQTTWSSSLALSKVGHMKTATMTVMMPVHTTTRHSSSNVTSLCVLMWHVPNSPLHIWKT
jgi:hypothetical protein